jgi:hypothetical protein
MSKELTPMEQFIEYLKSELIGISEWDDTKKFLQCEADYIRKKEREAAEFTLNSFLPKRTFHSAISEFLNKHYPLPG